eukprot:674496-Amorphochlora_amoeboformis.AAC.2
MILVISATVHTALGSDYSACLSPRTIEFLNSTVLRVLQELYLFPSFLTVGYDLHDASGCFVELSVSASWARSFRITHREESMDTES